MNLDMSPRSSPQRTEDRVEDHGRRGLEGRFAVAILMTVALLAAPTSSQAAWLTAAGGFGWARSGAVGPGSAPTAQVTSRTVRLDWPPAALSTGGTAGTYQIRRYDGAGTTRLPIDAGTCAALVTGTTCTHTGAPSGNWRYTVTPTYGLWHGAESPARQVTVAAPALTLTASVAKPGTTVTGTLTDFVGGESLRYRLDSPTGTELVGTLAGASTPAAVPGTGGGAVSVTIAAGTPDGSHTIYAVAAPSGDYAIARVVVDGTPPPAPTLVRTPAAVGGDAATFEFTEAESSATLECRLDAAPFAACTSPVDYTALAAGSHIFSVRATDLVGNTSAVTPFAWTVDTSVPNIAIGFPGAGMRANDAGFTAGCATPTTGDVCGAADDDVNSITVVHVSLQRVGTGQYWTGAAFTSSTEVWLPATGTYDWSYQVAAAAFPADGDYVLRARATNGTGYLGYDSRTLTVDRTAPPVPVLTSPPPATTGPTVTVGFTTGDATAGFECQLDTGAWTSCPNPQTFGGLTDGTHTLAVRAVDPAGNTSGATSVTWTVDAAPPVVGLTFPTPGPVNAAGYTASCASPATGDLCGTASDAGAGLAGVNVSIRSAATDRYWDGTGFTATTETWVPTTGAAPWTYPFDVASFPADGTYTIRGSATDAVGNTATASADMTLDTVAPPVPQIVRSPADPSGDTAVFDFTIAEPGAGGQCRLDGGSWSPCTAPVTYSPLPAGPHTFAVRSGDAAGNTSAAATRTWTVDLDLPVVNVTFPDPTRTYNDGGFSAGCSTPGGDLCGTATDAQGIARVEVSLQRAATGRYWDGAGFNSPTELFLPATGTTAWTYPIVPGAFPAEDTYTVRARATDTAGNAGVNSTTLTIDRTPPAAPTITSAPPSPAGGSASLSFTGESGATFQCRLDGSAWSGCASPTSYSGLPDGAHTFDVHAVDGAGNVGSAASHTWTVDATAPAVTITFPTTGGRYNDSGYNAGCGTASTGDVCGTATDAGGVTKVELSVRREGTGLYYTGSSFTATTQTWLPATGTTSWTYLLAAASFPADDTYTVTARATDTAGNTGTRTATLVIDRTRPTATGVAATNGGSVVRRLEAGDRLTLTFSEPVAPGSIIAGWNGTTSQSIGVKAKNGTNDSLTFWNSAITTQLPLGTVNLRRGDYVTGPLTFGATLTMSGATLTITLGAPSKPGSIGTAAGTANMTWTPSSTVTDLAGNSASTTVYAETDNDGDF